MTIGPGRLVLLLTLLLPCVPSATMTEQRNNNFNSNNNNLNFSNEGPFVVGILSPSTTVYIDQRFADAGGRRELSPPCELDLRRPQPRSSNANSFQITSVTVQGSRKGVGDDPAEDSADDLEETSHTDDFSSSELLDSPYVEAGYRSEDAAEDLSPCGGRPIVFAQVPAPAGADPNANGDAALLSPAAAFRAAIGPGGMVAGGVTVMTSKSESPVSAQVPIMNPLPDNWRSRFKVVKIVSSEPFRRGRWLCMDFKDPPAAPAQGPACCNGGAGSGASTPPLAQAGAGSGLAPVYELPINQTFSGNFVMGNQREMYGILLPQSDHLQPVTLVQDMSLQTAPAVDRNLNHLLDGGRIRVEPAPAPAVCHHHYLHHHCFNNNNGDETGVRQSPPTTGSANSNYSSVSNYSSNSVQAVPHLVNSADTGVRTNLINSVPADRFADGAQPLKSADVDNSESSQSAPEKVPPLEVGREVDPTSGSAASTGGNTVAIDNKIEQAMDLVKSHLMFAVREEVEVLKEKITELLERISQLEHENDILRANASAETLKQLSNQKKNAAGGSPGKQQPVAPVPPSS